MKGPQALKPNHARAGAIRHASVNTARIGRSRGGFTLIDVMVSMGVIALLIALLLPSFSKAKEAARRVVCGSNLRQVGLAINMYANDNRGRIPHSVFLRATEDGMAAPLQDMVVIRTDAEETQRRPWGQWDGIGMLYKYDYLPAPKIFYCPSHTGAHPFGDYTKQWRKASDTEIVSNYQYRGVGPNGALILWRIEPQRAAIVADGMRTIEDFNHQIGFNILRAGGNVNWLSDSGIVTALLNRSSTEPADPAVIGSFWKQLDD